MGQSNSVPTKFFFSARLKDVFTSIRWNTFLIEGYKRSKTCWLVSCLDTSSSWVQIVWYRVFFLKSSKFWYNLVRKINYDKMKWTRVEENFPLCQQLQKGTETWCLVDCLSMPLSTLMETTRVLPLLTSSPWVGGISLIVLFYLSWVSVPYFLVCSLFIKNILFLFTLSCFPLLPGW